MTTQPVVIGGRSFEVRMLTLGRLKACGPDLRIVRTIRKDELPTAEQMDAMIRIVYAALPEGSIPTGEFATLIDELPWDTGPLELSKAFEAVMVRAGFTKTEEPSPGEAASPERSISNGSTGSSSPEPAGPSSMSTT